ncbi:hypothetical protein K2173_022532 [Erythroxylum novogranatense]|uniref:Phytocyanin domain-containing protein n=1 Tax=Erythroxylum novogranatense TaxID=1862640 RepID=A0AAV8TKJ3_9ROSI|nr:hypothetical protein K2173_022532 [Erythroxylum novogranatense]
MELVERTLAIHVLLALMLQVIDATVYEVGDAAGWTNVGNVNYKKWAATKNFQLGDTVIFEYNAPFHNVMRVTRAMYRACNTSAPVATYTTGNDSITIRTRGHHYFICGKSGHCEAGQKVDINVPRDHQVPASSPSASTPPSPPVPSDKSPGQPSQKNRAMSLQELKISPGNLALAMAALATLVLGSA